MIFADAARTGRLVGELDEAGPAAREIMALAAEVDRGSRMSGARSKRAFVARPSDAEAWVRAPEPRRGRTANGDIFTARLTIDVTPALRGRIKVTAFQRGLTVADMLRDLLAREFPDKDGGDMMVIPMHAAHLSPMRSRTSN